MRLYFGKPATQYGGFVSLMSKPDRRGGRSLLASQVLLYGRQLFHVSVVSVYSGLQVSVRIFGRLLFGADPLYVTRRGISWTPYRLLCTAPWNDDGPRCLKWLEPKPPDPWEKQADGRVLRSIGGQTRFPVYGTDGRPNFKWVEYEKDDAGTI